MKKLNNTKPLIKSLVKELRFLSLLNVELADVENSIDEDEINKDMLIQLNNRKDSLESNITLSKNNLFEYFCELFILNSDLIGSLKNLSHLYIPNYDTLSTLIDRICIENVKLFHFKHHSLGIIEHKLNGILSLQDKILDSLCKELEDFILTTFGSGKYKFLKEERTFK